MKTEIDCRNDWEIREEKRMKTENKKVTHTPGPWRYQVSNAGEIGAKDKVTVEGPGGHIALVKRQMQENGRDTFGKPVIVRRNLLEVKANANLIASAPELLSAAKEAVITLENYKEDGDEAALGTLKMLRAVIAKAEAC